MLAAFLSELHRVSGEMVEQIIAEMREEQVSPPPLNDTSGAVMQSSLTTTNGLDLNALLRDPAALRALAGAGQVYDQARFEERLSLLEKTLSSTLNAVGQLLQAVQRKQDSSESEAETK